MANTGVKPTQVGEEYDFALGFDPGTGTVLMYGYLLENGTDWAQAPNIQDEQRIVTIASPNYSDRFTFYPKVTQSDWSGGEGQEFYVDPTKYYQSIGVDPTKTGRLQLLPSMVAKTISSPISNLPYLASNNAGSILLARGHATSQLSDVHGNFSPLNLSGAPLVASVEAGPQNQSLFVATASGANGGIYLISGYIGNNYTSSVLWTSDIVKYVAPNMMAYQSSPAPTGGLYYIRSDNTLQQIGAALATPNQVYSPNAMEDPLSMVVATSTGLLFATGQQGIGVQGGRTILYSFDGTTATRVLDLRGALLAAYEMNGVTYLLTTMEQSFPINTTQAWQFTLFAYANGQFSLLFDQRYAATDFRSGRNNGGGGALTGDGRFLYIGFPGFYGLAYDTYRSAFVRLGQAPVLTGADVTHAFYSSTADGLVEINFLYPTTITVYNSTTAQYTSTPLTTGNLTASWIDFGTPGVIKQYRCVDVELQQPLKTGGSIQVAYRLDQNAAFVNLPNVTTLPNGNLMFYMPSATRGYRIQLQITLNANNDGTSPIVRDVAITANPARVWKLSVSCRRGQQKRNGIADDQGVATDLLANLINAYEQGGFVTMYIPDPTNAAGLANPDNSGTALYVSQTTAKIEEYSWHTTVSPANRQDVDGTGFAMEGIADLIIAEQL